jgi:hypothetical protein
MSRYAAGFLTLLVAGLVAAGDPVSAPPLVTIEKAPKELGEVQASGDLLLTTDPRGKEVWLFDQAEQTVSRFNERGVAWGEPVRLTVDGLGSPPRVSRFATDGGSLAFVGGEGIYVFTLDGRSHLHERIFQPGDIIGGKGFTWLVSLTNLPHPVEPGRYLARKRFGDEVPRLILISGSDLEIRDSGLFESEQISGSAGAGRRLRLARAGDRFYAAEYANYRIFELDRRLKVRAEFRDPELTFEEGRPETGSDLEAPGGLAPEAVAEAMGDLGQDVSRPQGSEDQRPKPLSMRVAAEPVIRDVAWESDSQRLLILLDPETEAAHLYRLDALDPLTGVVQRTRIALPEGHGDVSLTQMSAGQGYLWFRGYKGSTPTFRLDKLKLAAGQEVELPEVSRMEDPDPDGGR